MPGPKKKSAVWEVFEFPVEGKVKCKKCGERYKYSGTTSSLINHIKKKHHSKKYDNSNGIEVIGKINQSSTNINHSFLTPKDTEAIKTSRKLCFNTDGIEEIPNKKIKSPNKVIMVESSETSCSEIDEDFKQSSLKTSEELLKDVYPLSNHHYQSSIVGESYQRKFDYIFQTKTPTVTEKSKNCSLNTTNEIQIVQKSPNEISKNLSSTSMFGNCNKHLFASVCANTANDNPNETSMKEVLDEKGAIIFCSPLLKTEVSEDLQDDLASFGNYMCTILRGLHPRLKLQAKNELLNVLNKYEIMQIDI